MRNRNLVLFMVLSVMLLFTTNIFAQKKAAKYVGVKKCKMCHNSKKSGKQFTIWQGTAHAKAFATLATEEAKAIGAKQGIADPQKSEKCIVCHTTAEGKVAVVATEGVGCETCHGPGSTYKSMKVMKGITAGTMNAADYGLVLPDEKRCVTCHNEKSPTYKKFDYKTFWAKIAHPVPKK